MHWTSREPGRALSRCPGATALLSSAVRRASAAYDGILRGRTEYKGRDTLVVEIVGQLRSDLARGATSGYALIDAKSGAWVYYESYSASPVSHWGTVYDFYVQEVHELTFPTAQW